MGGDRRGRGFIRIREFIRIVNTGGSRAVQSGRHHVQAHLVK
jgi:hypothetical protein